MTSSMVRVPFWIQLHHPVPTWQARGQARCTYATSGCLPQRRRSVCKGQCTQHTNRHSGLPAIRLLRLRHGLRPRTHSGRHTTRLLCPATNFLTILSTTSVPLTRANLRGALHALQSRRFTVERISVCPQSPQPPTDLASVEPRPSPCGTPGCYKNHPDAPKEILLAQHLPRSHSVRECMHYLPPRQDC